MPPEFRGNVPKMTTESGEPKGLQQTLLERGFNVRNLCQIYSSLPFENNNCCIYSHQARRLLLIKISMFETVIQVREAGINWLEYLSSSSIPLKWFNLIVRHNYVIIKIFLTAENAGCPLSAK